MVLRFVRMAPAAVQRQGRVGVDRSVLRVGGHLQVEGAARQSHPGRQLVDARGPRPDRRIARNGDVEVPRLDGDRGGVGVPVRGNLRVVLVGGGALLDGEAPGGLVREPVALEAPPGRGRRHLQVLLPVHGPRHERALEYVDHTVRVDPRAVGPSEGPPLQAKRVSRAGEAIDVPVGGVRRRVMRVPPPPPRTSSAARAGCGGTTATAPESAGAIDGPISAQAVPAATATDLSTPCINASHLDKEQTGGEPTRPARFPTPASPHHARLPMPC